MELLKEPWWQGVAGLAQIIAAVLTVITVLQARRMIKQADQDRRDAASPVWEYMGMDDGRSKDSASFVLANAGAGAARDTTVEWVSKNGSKPERVTFRGHTGAGRVILPDDTGMVTIRLKDGAQVAGTLVLRSKTRVPARLRAVSL